jgi:hypothetical protein
MIKNRSLTRDDGIRYFDGDGHMVRNATVSIYGKKYFFDENGIGIRVN